jgi:hypothetical protein
MALLDFFRVLLVADHFTKQGQTEWNEKQAIRRVKLEMLMIKYSYGIIEFEEYYESAIEVQIEGDYSKINARNQIDETIKVLKEAGTDFKTRFCVRVVLNPAR